MLSNSDSKSALTSVTVWGGILVLLPEIIEGIDTILNSGIVPDPYASVLHVVGGLLSILGRFRATKTIKGVV